MDGRYLSSLHAQYGTPQASTAATTPTHAAAPNSPGPHPHIPSVMKDLSPSPPSTLSIAIAIGLLGLLTGYFVGTGSSLFSSASSSSSRSKFKSKKAGKSKKSWPNSYDVKIHEDSSSEDVAGVGTGETDEESGSGSEREDEASDEESQEIRSFADSAEEVKLVLCVRTDLGMTKGKIAAQASHATLAVYKSLVSTASASRLLRRWESAGQTKIAVQVPSEEALLTLQATALSLGLCARSIRDAGRTQIAAGSMTVLGVFGPKSEVDRVTGGLKLL